MSGADGENKDSVQENAVAQSSVEPKTNSQNKPQLWKKGQSGNPSGRPKGASGKVRQEIRDILNAGAKDVAITLVAAARMGDMKAADMIMKRLFPERKGSFIPLAMPKLESTENCKEAFLVIQNALEAEEITTAEAAELAAVVESARRNIEQIDLVKRIEELEREREK